MTPYVIQTQEERFAQVDVFSKLIEKRIIYFNGEVDENSCAVTIAQLIYLYSQSPTEDISMYINSPGGSVYDGLGLYDTMCMVKKTLNLNIVVTGLAASMGSILLSAGTRGRRFALQNSTILIHQPMTGVGPHTQASDIEIVANETNRLKKNLAKILSDASGKKLEEVIEDCDRDNWLAPEKCLPGVYGKYGLIDSIITEFPK